MSDALLRRDPCCRRNLLWGLVHDHPVEAIVSRCRELGFAEVCHKERLWIFTTEERDQVVVVWSGRVQLRVDLEREPGQRKAVAQALAERLLA